MVSGKVIIYVAVSSSAVLLAACGGYQAPVSEQGERQVVRPPIIVDSNTPASSFYVPNNRTGADSAGFGYPATVSGAAVSRGSSSSYRVRPGDTLFSIAFAHDMDFRSLAVANSLSPPYTILVGQELNLDLNRVSSISGGQQQELGTAVSNNRVAQAQATINRAGGLIRRAIDTVSDREPGWQWPHRGNLLQGFAADRNEGIDLGGRVGDPVLAAGDGDVVYAGQGVQGSGNLIILRHNDRYLSAYAHNSRMLVQEGLTVRGGEKIAELGQTAAGVPMLHFEIRIDGSPVDPMSLLPLR